MKIQQTVDRTTIDVHTTKNNTEKKGEKPLFVQILNLVVIWCLCTYIGWHMGDIIAEFGINWEFLTTKQVILKCLELIFLAYAVIILWDIWRIYLDKVVDILF